MDKYGTVLATDALIVSQGHLYRLGEITVSSPSKFPGTPVTGGMSDSLIDPESSSREQACLFCSL